MDPKHTNIRTALQLLKLIVKWDFYESLTNLSFSGHYYHLFHFLIIAQSCHMEEEDVKNDLPVVLTRHCSEVCLASQVEMASGLQELLGLFRTETRRFI